MQARNCSSIELRLLVLQQLVALAVCGSKLVAYLRRPHYVCGRVELDARRAGVLSTEQVGDEHRPRDGSCQ